MSDVDADLARLLGGQLPPAPPDPQATGIQLDRHGVPIDPAQTTRYDRQMELHARDRHAHALELDRQARQERAAERAEIEAHWAREPQRQAAVQWQHPHWPPVQQHIVWHALAPQWAPEPAVTHKRRRRHIGDKGLAVGLVTVALAYLAFIWMFAAVCRYQGQQDAQTQQHYSTSTTTGAHR